MLPPVTLKPSKVDLTNPADPWLRLVFRALSIVFCNVVLMSLISVYSELVPEGDPYVVSSATEINAFLPNCTGIMNLVTVIELLKALSPCKFVNW